MKLVLSCALLLLAGCASNQHDDMQPVSNAVCPISGKPVDGESMLEVEGRQVNFCCEKCCTKAAEDPGKYADLAYPE